MHHLSHDQLAALSTALADATAEDPQQAARRLTPTVERIVKEQVEHTLAAAEQRFQTLIETLPETVQIPHGYHDLIKHLVRAAHTGAASQEPTGLASSP